MGSKEIDTDYSKITSVHLSLTRHNKHIADQRSQRLITTHAHQCESRRQRCCASQKVALCAPTGLKSPSSNHLIPTGWVSAVHGNPYMEPDNPPPNDVNSHTINSTYRRFQLQLAVSRHMDEVNFWRLEGLPLWTMEWIMDYSLTILKPLKGSCGKNTS